jgi:hypothetical protein
MRVFSGPARVITSGTATTRLGAGVRFELDVSPPLVVELELDSDPDDPAIQVRARNTEEGHRFTLLNFDDATGRGTARPIHLGYREEGAIELHFRVFRYGDTPDRTVHYTFYAVPVESAEQDR